MLRTTVVIAAVALAPATRAAPPAQTSQSPSLALTHITVIDGTGAPPMRDMTVLLTGDRIPGFTLHEELLLLVESGLTPLQAVLAARRSGRG